MEMSQNGGGNVQGKREEESSNRLYSRKQCNIIFLICFALSQLLALSAVILVVIWTQKHLGGFDWGLTKEEVEKEFSFHPLFFVIGLIVLNGEASLLYRVFPTIKQRFLLKCLHAALQLIAFCFTVVALKAEWDYKHVFGYDDMYSLHSWLGLGACILFACQLTLGFLTFLVVPLRWRNPKTSTFARYYLPIHQFFGSLILVLAVSSALMGFTEKFIFDDHSPKVAETYHSLSARFAIGNSLGIILSLYGILVVFLLVASDFSRENRQPRE